MGGADEPPEVVVGWNGVFIPPAHRRDNRERNTHSDALSGRVRPGGRFIFWKEAQILEKTNLEGPSLLRKEPGERYSINDYFE